MAPLKIVNIRTASITLSALVRDAQEAPVCLTRHGHPMAILVGVQGQELADILREWDPTLRAGAAAAPAPVTRAPRARGRRAPAR